MTEILKKFSVDAVKFDNQILLCLLVIWFVVVGCGISSVLTQDASRKERWFWIAVIFGVPVFGLLSYLPFSFRREKYPGFFKVKK